VPRHLKTLVDSLVRTYRMSSSQTKTATSGHLLLQLEAVRSGDATVDISRRELFLLVSKLSEEFRHFALLQRYVTLGSSGVNVIITT
jgi:hypothetical protein